MLVACATNWASLPASLHLGAVYGLPILQRQRSVVSHTRCKVKVPVTYPPCAYLGPKSAPYHQSDRLKTCTVRAASESTSLGASDGFPWKAVKITAYIFLWYGFNVAFNIVNKQALTALPCPWLLSTVHLGVSSCCMGFLWSTGLQPKPKLSAPFLKILAYAAFFHLVGHVSAAFSFSQVAISFAHVVKSAEPVFSVLLSGPILGDVYPYYVWLSLVPIVFGCSLSALKEMSFSWPGFNNAMLSNFGMVLRGIYSKRMMVEFKDRNLDGINLFGLISIVACLYCAPLALLFESKQWAPACASAVKLLGIGRMFFLAFGGGVLFHSYNQVAYMVFNQGLTPVTFSVANTMKRVAVVVITVAFFRNPVSLLNWIGAATAIFGTFLYSLAKDKAAKHKASMTSS